MKTTIIVLLLSLNCFAQKITITATDSTGKTLGTSVIQFDSDTTLTGLDTARQKGTELIPDPSRRRGLPPMPLAIPANLAEWVKTSILPRLQAVATMVAPNTQIQTITKQMQTIQGLQSSLKAAQAAQVK